MPGLIKGKTMAQKAGVLGTKVSFSVGTLVLFGIIFGAVGGYAIWKTFAAKPTSGVTLTTASTASRTAAGTYSVTAESRKMISNKYNLWGKQACMDSSNTPISVEYHPVRWPNSSSNTGTLNEFAAPSASASQCSVFVTVFPDVWTPVSNTVVFNP